MNRVLVDSKAGQRIYFDLSRASVLKRQAVETALDLILQNSSSRKDYYSITLTDKRTKHAITFWYSRDHKRSITLTSAANILGAWCPFIAVTSQSAKQ